MQIGITTLMVADAISTEKIQYDPDIIEGNALTHVFLGDNPGTSETYLYFGTLIVSSYLISAALPVRWRPYYQSLQMLDNGFAIINNCDAGLC